MANLHEISRRMSSIRSTMQITRTMSMISTARVRKALDRAEAASPYKEAITLMLANVAGAGFNPKKQPLLATHKVEKNVLFLVIASDRGLAGGFNILPQREAKGASSEIITCGRMPTEYFTYRNIKPTMSYVGISSEPTADQADRIASYIMDGYIKGKIDRVVIKYWHAKNRVDQEQVTEQLLPISRDKLTIPNKPRTEEALSQVKTYNKSEYQFSPSASQVLDSLMPAYIKTVIFHALLDSAAAEHGARRRAMQSATDNAENVLGALSRTYNRERQGAITTELNEIIGGAAALEDM